MRQRDAHEHGGVQPTAGAPAGTAPAEAESAGSAAAPLAEAPPLTRREALARERAAQAGGPSESTRPTGSTTASAESTTTPTGSTTASAEPTTASAAVSAPAEASDSAVATGTSAAVSAATLPAVSAAVLSPSITARKPKRSRVRTAQIVGQAVVITALVGGTGAFVGLSTQVDLTVDGETSSTRTFGDTVGDVLAAEGIEVDPADRVSPGLDADLTRGMDITVSRSKDLALTLDGIESAQTTTAHTVGQALTDLGIDPAGAEISHTLDAPLDAEAATALSVVTPKTVTVRADGESIPVEATAASVAEVLDRSGVDVAATDVVTAPLGAPVVSGQTIDILRTATSTEEVEEAIEAPVEKKKTDSLVEGETKVETKGKDGKRSVVYTVSTLNGDEVSRVEESEKVLEKPVTEVVLVGTGDPNDPDSYTTPSDDGGTMTTQQIKDMLGGPGSPWYKIAQCESEFNPKAVNRQNNKYFGLFQFGIPTWQGVGGTGNPADASPQEQFERAKVLQQRYGWSQWECAGMVGVG